MSANHDTTGSGADVLIPIAVPGGTSQVALCGDEVDDSLYLGDC